MPFLHLGYNPERAGAPTGKDVQGVLDKAKDWMQYAPNCWLIYTGREARFWYSKLQALPGMKDDASFLISEIPLGDKSKRAGWLPESVWDWINKPRR
jgi:hypothetical protein